jgi:hypothetical protein
LKSADSLSIGSKLTGLNLNCSIVAGSASVNLLLIC